MSAGPRDVVRCLLFLGSDGRTKHCWLPSGGTRDGAGARHRHPSNDVEPLQVDALHSSEHTAHFQHEHLSTHSTGKAFDIIIESPSLPPLDYNPRYPTKEIQIRVDRQPLPSLPSFYLHHAATLFLLERKVRVSVGAKDRKHNKMKLSRLNKVSENKEERCEVEASSPSSSKREKRKCLSLPPSFRLDTKIIAKKRAGQYDKNESVMYRDIGKRSSS